MKRVILGLGLTSVLAGVGFAQTTDVDASSATSVNKNGRDIGLQSGTRIAAQLQSSLDVKKARVGDQVILKTTQAIRQNGRVMVDKGSRLVGRVTEVQQSVRGNASSKVSILFDRIENGRTTLPIEAMITSVTQVGSRASVNDSVDADVSGSSSTRTSARSQSGGLLGGVTDTVGGVVNTTSRTVGGVTDSVGRTVGSTTETVGRTVRGIQISQSSSADAEGGSTLSLAGDNLRLEKGTTFNLRLSSSASVRND